MSDKHTGSSTPSSALCSQDEKSIFLRGRDLVEELMGRHSFTEVLYFLTVGVMPNAAQTRILDSCLVTLMEHGINPSTIVSRLISDNNPNDPQVAIAAGLLAIGGRFGGTAEQCAQILVELESQVAEHDETAIDSFVELLLNDDAPIPGFGHLHHKPDDPRAIRLIAIAEESGLALRYTPLLQRLSSRIDVAKGRHLTINATGAIGALLLDIGVPVSAIRCFCVVSRSAGLTAHIVEEKQKPSSLAIWRASRAAVPYVSGDAGESDNTRG